MPSPDPLPKAARAKAAQALAAYLQEITEALAATHTERDVLEIVLTPAVQALGAVAGIVLLVNGTDQQLRIAGTRGYEDGTPTLWQEGPLEDQVLIADILRMREACYFEHAGSLREAFPELESRTGPLAAVANAALPMFLDGVPIGIIVLDFQEPHHFTAAERRFLMTLAAQCAIALARADATEQLEARVEERTRQLQAKTRELEAQTRELAVRNEELQTFYSSVSHELRTPVRHVTGFLKLARRSLDGRGRLDEETARYLAVVEQAGADMNILIDALLELFSSSQRPIQCRPVDLQQLVTHVQSAAMPTLQGRQVQWDIGHLPPVEADFDVLKQVLTELIDNALKFTQRQAETVIRVRADDLNAVWRVSVQDNGVGFDPRYHARLFQMFQRLHRQDEFSGKGTGLARVRRLILRHGGDVAAQGQIGAGATFSFTLPKGGVQPTSA